MDTLPSLASKVKEQDVPRRNRGSRSGGFDAGAENFQSRNLAHLAERLYLLDAEDHDLRELQRRAWKSHSSRRHVGSGSFRTQLVKAPTLSPRKPAGFSAVVGEGEAEPTGKGQVNASTQTDQVSLLDAPSAKDGELIVSLEEAIVESFGFSKVIVSYADPQDKKAPRKTVLHSIDGHFVRGDMVALIGPSGSGKTTLLNMLSKQTFRPTTQVSGDIMVNKRLVNEKTLRAISSYIAQEDAFYPTQTVKEVMTFHARIKLRMTHTIDEQNEVVETLLAKVGLTGQQNTKIGGQLPGGLFLKGISGGEKRRLSLAAGIIAGPQILFADEPTSGLDSFAALRVMALLQGLSRSMIVVTTIHQPRHAIWELFDKVMILSAGQLLYAGKASEASDWFTGLGYARPENTSAPDFILDLINISFGDGDQEPNDVEKPAEVFGGMGTAERVQECAEIFKASDTYRDYVGRFMPTTKSLEKFTLDGLDMTAWEKTVDTYHRTLTVLGRNSLSYMRNPGNVLVRTLATVAVGLVVGIAFWKIGEDPESMNATQVQNAVGSFFFSALSLFLDPFASISLFIYDRTFFSRERAQLLYGSGIYFSVNIFLEFWVSVLNGITYAIFTYPMVGYTSGFFSYMYILCIHITASSYIIQFFALAAKNQDMAFAVGTVYSSVATLAAGFYVSFTQTSVIMKGLQWISILKYTTQALGLNEYSDPDPAFLYLQANKLDRPDTVGANIGAICCFYVVFGIASYWCITNLNKQMA